MKKRLTFNALLSLALVLPLMPTALARTTWYVDGVVGHDSNDCKTQQTACRTIGHAISLAAAGDSIKVNAATYTENLEIPFSLNLVGANASTTIVDARQIGRGVDVYNPVAKVTLSNLTIRNGHFPLGGGVYNNANLHIRNSTITMNVVVSSSADGGGIANDGTLVIDDSSILANSAQGGNALGGGIFNTGTLTINNSTVAGNTITHNGLFTSAHGGGVANSAGTLTISNSTISGNESDDYTGGIDNIFGTTTLLQNTIVAFNTSMLFGNCSNAITSNGYNLSSDLSCNFNGSGDLNNTDPKLGVLGDHGGPTQTIPLLKGSPAVDAGNPNGCTDGQGHLLRTDQRGAPRPDEQSGRCDMGAYEVQMNSRLHQVLERAESNRTGVASSDHFPLHLFAPALGAPRE